MRLGGRLTGRVVTRSKSRGGDGFSSDSSELLPAVVQHAAAMDPAAACKGDLTRSKQAVQAQLSIPATVVASARLSVTNGTTAAPAPAAPPALAPAPPSKPRHQRSHSAEQTPKGLALQSEVANDLACIADTLIKACADPEQQQQQQPNDADTVCEGPLSSAGAQRRSARLAATAPAGQDGSSKALSRASAPARQQKRVPVSSSSLAASSGNPSKRASVAGPVASAPAAAPVVVAASSPPPSLGPSAASSDSTSSDEAGSSQGRRVRFASGPLDPQRHPNSTGDGHPASEGALAVPVRRVPVSYGMDLTRGNVLMLEQLLGTDCSLSVTRLKRRVGLLPPIRPPRPYASSPGGGVPPGGRRHGSRS